MSRAEIIARARAAMDKALAEAWEARAETVPLSSPREALILASIIERETVVPAERARVAGVFANRLRRNMPLQSDATVVYAASEGVGVLDRPISRADLELDNPFNTYRNRGLPPGPIAAPGLASIRVFQNHDDIVDHCCHAGNRLIEPPWRIMSIGLRNRTHRF